MCTLTGSPPLCERTYARHVTGSEHPISEAGAPKDPDKSRPLRDTGVPAHSPTGRGAPLLDTDRAWTLPNLLSLLLLAGVPLTLWLILGPQAD